MSDLAVITGCLLIVTVLTDMVNTLVTTSTSNSRWWLTSVLYRKTWSILRSVVIRIDREPVREALLATYAPVSVLLLLVAWVTQQVVGFGLVWWGLGGVDGLEGLGDAIYYSGVVYFTLGFGEMVPADLVPRFGSLVEALLGVLTLALVVGYLPSLYAAYSERERKLMTLDDGTEHRITPTNLLLSRSPTGDVDDVLRFFEGWEDWVAGVIETHTTFPMLQLFRSKAPGQHWITALGLLCDTALQCQAIEGARDRAPYWLLRRSILLFNHLIDDADLSPYRARLDASYADGLAVEDDQSAFHQVYLRLEEQGFDLVDYEEARREITTLRRLYDAQLEYLIDEVIAPRGFWGHTIGHRVASMEGRAEPLPEEEPNRPMAEPDH